MTARPSFFRFSCRPHAPPAPRRRKVRSVRNGRLAIPHCAPLLLLSERDPLRWARVRLAACGGFQEMRFATARAACTPEAPAWARPRVTPAPSPAAKKLGRAVSSSGVSWRRAE